jgi:hypothetical protein
VKKSRVKTSKIWTVSTEEFYSLVKNNYCIRDIVEGLGYKHTSGSMAIKVKERIAIDGIDTSHFLGRKAKKTLILTIL